MPPRSFLCVVDLADASCNWCALPSDSRWPGVWPPGRRRRGRHAFLPFGLKTAPSSNDSGLKEVLWLLQAHENAALTDFVDDNLRSQSTREDARQELARVVFFKAGIPVSVKEGGFRPPSQVQTWVGWVFNSEHYAIR